MNDDQPDEQPTCGKGLAANAVLPQRLADLISTLTDNLEAHLPALDRSDPAARAEYEVYVALVHEQRTIAAALTASARRMASQRDLPMGRHDEAALTDAKVGAAFVGFVRAKRALAELLRTQESEDEAMLAAMREAGATQS